MTTPTVVLVHGAFADGSSFAPLASTVAGIEGPGVSVGHSCGGAVITVAGAAESIADEVVGLVHLAGYALEEGESLGELRGRFPHSPLAERAGMTSVEVDSSHAVMLAHAEEVADVIRTAVAALGARAA